MLDIFLFKIERKIKKIMDLRSVLNNLGLEGPVFYKQPKGEGQRGARFSMDVTLVKGGKCQLSIVPGIEGLTSGRPQKGVPQYEYKKKVVFSLEPHECNSIASVIPALLNGTYENPAAEKPFKTTFQLEHYPSGGKSRLLLYRPQTTSGSTVPTIGVTIMPSKESGLEKNSFILNPAELRIFSDFVRKCGSDLPFYSSFAHAIVKLCNSSIAKSSSSSGVDVDKEDINDKPDHNVSGEFVYDTSEPAPATSSIEEYDWNFQ